MEDLFVAVGEDALLFLSWDWYAKIVEWGKVADGEIWSGFIAKRKKVVRTENGSYTLRIAVTLKFVGLIEV